MHHIREGEKMKEVKEMLLLIEEKHRFFKQQQLRFIAALERSRESAHCQIRPVSSVMEVQWYMTHHCCNSTDQRAFSIFLEIMANLKALLQMINSLASAKNFSSEVLDTCRNILSSDCNFSQLQAHFPHDVVNRLSCTEAKHYYAGVVSVIPVTLDVLSMAISQMSQVSNEAIPQTDLPQNGHEQNKLTNMSEKPHASSYRAVRKGASGWRPVWRPPWRN